jgi:hypothetical protein
MVCEGMDQAFYLDAYQIALKRRGTMGGDKRGHSVLCADEAEERRDHGCGQREVRGTGWNQEVSVLKSGRCRS